MEMPEILVVHVCTEYVYFVLALGSWPDQRCDDLQGAHLATAPISERLACLSQPAVLCRIYGVKTQGSLIATGQLWGRVGESSAAMRLP